MMTVDIRLDIAEARFAEGWADLLPRIRSRQAGEGFACGKCEKINLCGYCPAFFRLEGGLEDARSEYLCKMGELRFSRIRDYLSPGEDYGKQ